MITRQHRPQHSSWRAGQALAELAVFGSIMLIALAGLVRIGMQYNYSQQTAQEAFRRAERDAQTRVPNSHFKASGAYRVYQDRYIPDPTRPFVSGQHAMYTGSASVLWGNWMNVQQIDLEDEIPEMKFQVNGEERVLKLARFMAWVAQPKTRWRRLARIFCDNDADTEEEYEDCAHVLRRSGSRVIHNGFITLNRTRDFLEVEVVGGAAFNGHSPRTIIVVDRCAGELADAETCRRQCQKLKCGPRSNTIDELNTCQLAGTTVIAPLPSYCEPLMDPTNNYARYEAMRLKPHGFDSSNFARTLDLQDRMSGSTRQQTRTVNEREQISGRILRYQRSDFDRATGTGFTIQEDQEDDERHDVFCRGASGLTRTSYSTRGAADAARCADATTSWTTP